MFSVRTDQQCSQTQSTVCSQCHRKSFTTTFMKILGKHTHTRLYFYCHVIRKYEGEQNFMKLYWVLLQINFLSISWFWNLYSLMLFQKLQDRDLSKISNTVSARSCFFKVWYPRWASRIRNEDWNVACQCTTHTAVIINGSYMFHLQSSYHQAVYVRNTKVNRTSVVYIYN